MTDSHHVQGSSEFVDDRPFVQGELQVGVLYSPHAKAKIQKFDKKNALKIPGVVQIFTAKDLNHNIWGSIFQDQPLLADNEVNFVGEVVALIAAENKKALAKAKTAICIEYQVLPAILSLREARLKKSYIGPERKIERGQVDQIFSGISSQNQFKIIKDQLTIRGADHFYLESQVAVAYPKEDGQIEVHSSSQHPTEVQHMVAHSLGLSAKDVTCIVKRMGGAFGGKESQAAPFAVYAALVAHRLKRAARLVLSKDDDMIMTGKRNPFQNEYRVAFDSNGRIQALDVQMFSDGGAFADLSTAIMERAMLHIDNAYFIPHVRIRGQVCRTNFHPHTAFRGFGAPKGVATIERIIEQIAHCLNTDPLEIRKINCYTDKNTAKEERNTTPYGQKVENNCLPDLFEKLEKKCDYWNRRKEITESNKKPPNSQIRGLSLTPVKFGISFTTRYLNQGNALVIIHRDGSVQGSTGATEMGQGVNTKIAQLLAEDLGLPQNHIRIMPTSTEKNANTSPTAASSGTDLNGMAALLALRKIKNRLSELALQLLEFPESKWAKNTAGSGTEKEVLLGAFPKINTSCIRFEDNFVFSEKNPTKKITFCDLVNEAYLNRISLSDYAHYRTPDLSFNKISGEGKAFSYFTQGVAASEVSVDVFTGQVKVLRTDILMDLGRPLNKPIDWGQVAGAFVQGMGWVTTENLFYSPEGKLLSHSPSTYKIPNIQDTPRIFNIDFLENEANKTNIRGSKAVGEPPLLLAISVWTSIQDALRTLPRYRENKYPNIQLPATSEVILNFV